MLSNLLRSEPSHRRQNECSLVIAGDGGGGKSKVRLGGTQAFFGRALPGKYQWRAIQGYLQVRFPRPPFSPGDRGAVSSPSSQYTTVAILRPPAI